MLVLAKLIGVIIMVIGTVIMLNPDVFKRMVSFWKVDKRLYIAGVVRLIFAIVFLSVASSCRLPAVIYTFGVLVLIGAVLVFALGSEKMKRMLAWWDAKPPSILRLMGLAALLMGALIIYSV